VLKKLHAVYIYILVQLDTLAIARFFYASFYH